jgi:hypothetical protein
MNSLEKKMVELLIDLRQNHHVSGVKAEFEAEGTRLEEAMRLKEVVTRADLELTIKIGGCEAIKDMYDARVIGVKKIVAPMIETAYALKKYLSATKFAFPEDEREDKSFFINIETETGYKNLESMMSLPEIKDLDGIVLGRVDMTGSLGLGRDDINNNTIFEIANDMSLLCEKHNLEMIIGGGVSVDSLNFFKNLKGKLSKFETRKIIFDAPLALQCANIEKGLLKAVDFELKWLQNKCAFYGLIYKEDEKRIAMLEARYRKMIDKVSR